MKLHPIALFAGVATLLSACADPAEIKAALATYRGHPIDAVIARMGYPDSQMQVAGRDVYVYTTIDTYTVQGTSRSVPNNQGGYDTVYEPPEVITSECSYFFETDAQNIVRHTDFKGDCYDLPVSLY